MHIDGIGNSQFNGYVHDPRNRMAPATSAPTPSQLSGPDVSHHLQAVVSLPAPQDSSTTIQEARELLAAGRLDSQELIRQAAANLLAHGI